MTVRARLTGWYAAAAAAVCVAYAVTVFAFLRARLHAEMDRVLQADFEYAKLLARAALAAGRDTTPGTAVPVVPADVPRPHPHAPGDRWVQARWGGLRLADLAPGDAAALPWDGRLPEHTDGPVGARLADGTAVRLLAGPYRIGAVDVQIRVARSEAGLHAALADFALVLGLGLPLAVALAGAGGFALARRALAPVDRMATQAQAITAERLDARLPVGDPGDELGRLATVVNDTLARLERSFDELRRFTADASHELRTPLAALRLVGEVGLRDDADVTALRETVGSMLEEGARLTRLVDDLLTLARADAGRLVAAREPLDGAALVREVAEALAPLADEAGVALEIHAPAPVPCTADRAVLRRALVNLLDNAVKHSPRGAVVRVSATTMDGTARFVVADRGLGIAPAHHARIFERFYRVDPARADPRGGTGLGLAIARESVRAHGGTIAVESVPGAGSTFTVMLPADSRAP